MTTDESDESRELVVFRDETSDLVFIDGDPAPQGYASVAWKLGEDGSRFIAGPTVDVVAVTHTISKRRPRRREPIE